MSEGRRQPGSGRGALWSMPHREWRQSGELAQCRRRQLLDPARELVQSSKQCAMAHGQIRYAGAVGEHHAERRKTGTVTPQVEGSQFGADARQICTCGACMGGSQGVRQIVPNDISGAFYSAMALRRVVRSRESWALPHRGLYRASRGVGLRVQCLSPQWVLNHGTAPLRGGKVVSEGRLRRQSKQIATRHPQGGGRHVA